MNIKNIISIATILCVTLFATTLSCKPVDGPFNTTTTGAAGGGVGGSSSVSSTSTSVTSTSVTSTSASGLNEGGNSTSSVSVSVSSGGGVGGTGGVEASSTTNSVTSTASGETVPVEVCDLKCPRVLPVHGEYCDGNLDQYCEYAQGACRSARCRVGINLWEVNIMDPCVCYE